MRNTQEGDVKEIGIVCTVANSLSKEYDRNEVRSWEAKWGRGFLEKRDKASDTVEKDRQ